MEKKQWEKQLLLSKLKMSHCPETDSHIRDKVKVVLYLSNYETKKEQELPTGIDTSDLVYKNILFL